MERMRKPFQGVGNIIRFNWHFYLLSLLLVTGYLLFKSLLPPAVAKPAGWMCWVAIAMILLSLLTSWYVYDFSGLYQLQWLVIPEGEAHKTILNIHAGFDETSGLIRARFPDHALFVFDFYDPKKHTELSVRRARKAYGPYPGTLPVSTSRLPLPDRSMGTVLVILSAHEIRDRAERTAFFVELSRVLKPGGQIIVVEHLRNPANFLAYNIGFFHFYSRHSWAGIFELAGLKLTREGSITPLIRIFTLSNYGMAS